MIIRKTIFRHKPTGQFIKHERELFSLTPRLDEAEQHDESVKTTRKAFVTRRGITGLYVDGKGPVPLTDLEPMALTIEYAAKTIA
jgi:hypothetical protein